MTQSNDADMLRVRMPARGVAGFGTGDGICATVEPGWLQANVLFVGLRVTLTIVDVPADAFEAFEVMRESAAAAILTSNR